MEKQAVVKEGITPSEVSGNKSDFIKNGKALAKGEDDNISESEERLAKQFENEYNVGNKNK